VDEDCEGPVGVETTGWVNMIGGGIKPKQAPKKTRVKKGSNKQVRKSRDPVLGGCRLQGYSFQARKQERGEEFANGDTMGI
jgi:hypothetical protein